MIGKWYWSNKLQHETDPGADKKHISCSPDILVGGDTWKGNTVGCLCVCGGGWRRGYDQIGYGFISRARWRILLWRVTETQQICLDTSGYDQKEVRAARPWGGSEKHSGPVTTKSCAWISSASSRSSPFSPALSRPFFVDHCHKQTSILWGSRQPPEWPPISPVSCIHSLV